jgi:class 3 adenylate cyclase
MAARISSRAAPNEVLVSGSVVETAAADDLRFDAAGDADLKGFATPIGLYRAASA